MGFLFLSWWGDIRQADNGTREAGSGHDCKVAQRKRILWLKPRLS